MTTELDFLSRLTVAGRMSRRDFLGRAAALGASAAFANTLLAGAAQAQTPPSQTPAPQTPSPPPAPTSSLTRDLNSGPPAPAQTAQETSPVSAPKPRSRR